MNMGGIRRLDFHVLLKRWGLCGSCRRWETDPRGWWHVPLASAQTERERRAAEDARAEARAERDARRANRRMVLALASRGSIWRGEKDAEGEL